MTPPLDPDFFHAIAHELRTQDNACTADPIYCAQEKIKVWGFDEDYAEGDPVWITDDGEGTEASPAKARRLEAVYDQTGKVRDGWQRLFANAHWETCQTFLTKASAESYLKNQHHRHQGELRLYVESAYRNPEMKKLREQLLAVADYFAQSTKGAA